MDNQTDLTYTRNFAEKEGVGLPVDPLYLDIDDDDLVKTIDQRLSTSREFFDKKIHLTERRKLNEVFRFGRQLTLENGIYKKTYGDNAMLAYYESRFQDNVIYEIEATKKPLALTKLPDMIVTPGNQTDEAKETAKQVSKIIDDELKSRERRGVLAMAYQHRPVYFTGIIKYLWNPEINDYEFVNVFPENVIVSSRATSSDADKIDTIIEVVPSTIEEMFMKFPEKKEELKKNFQNKGLLGEKPTWKQLATPVDYYEVWFDYYKEAGDGKWETINAVLWKFDTVILKKIKNPNYDYEGEVKHFSYDEQGQKMPVDEEMLAQSMMQGMVPGMPPLENVGAEQVYHNYFDRPHKPYFFVTYDQWGKMVYDETTRIEQVMSLQESHNKRGKQIDETLDRRDKYVASASALTKEDMESNDMNDPNQDLRVTSEDVNKALMVVKAERPTPGEFQNMEWSRDRMYAMTGSTAIRGDLQSDVATSNQIAREADFTMADDEVEDTINAASEWMAAASLQMIKLRYTQDHFRKLLGAEGDTVFMRLNQDMIDDGMEVKIKASGTDKIKAQKNALELAKLQLTDPLTFFEDMGLSDPEGRAEKLLTLQTNPAEYLMKYVMKQPTDTNALAAGLLGGAGATQPPPAQGIAPTGGEPLNTPVPTQPTPQNTTNIPTEPPVLPQGSPRML